MAQLVKLSDYISRYEIDLYRYTSRYTRLKKERWENAKREWIRSKEGNHTTSIPTNNILDQSLKGRFRKLPWFTKKKEENLEANGNLQREIKNKSEEAFKESFKEEIFQFQLNWASSTISEKSRIKPQFKFDHWLTLLTKDFPDSYILFYKPVLILKKAPVDLEVILVTPTELWLIAPLEGDESTIYDEVSDRFWLKRTNDREEKILHPAIQLKRMRTVAEHLLLQEELSFPIRTVIIAKDGYIDVPQASQRIKMLDKRTFPEWFEKMRQNRTPMKHQQLKVSDALLKHSLTVSEVRGESLDEENDTTSFK
ncbi:hypothetical protein LGQ02_16005 [Bacillus shivajii]|uniref:hypothetical protein n=1 Tax=Bacillus shivajii TaxID=1983719 RepID=UPI001CF9E9E1|nr:hypothetical protein [Bacillus shivajii]UCZ52333.1 hypothetical protein LGQ02_16005 [Bacillus shivajii]